MTTWYRGYQILWTTGRYEIVGLPVAPFLTMEAAREYIDDLLDKP